MSEWIGKIVTCDRCGREVRRKLLERTELDGGFTHTNRFVEMPETWKYRHDTGWLCPDCADEFQRRLDAFMKKRREPTMTISTAISLLAIVISLMAMSMRR